MTTPDDYVADMKLFGRLTDRDIDRLLDGRVPEDVEDLDDLARHLGGLKRVESHVPQDVAERQIAQIVHTSQRLRQAGWSAPGTNTRPRRKGRSMQKRLALLTAKIGAVLVGASMLTAGMAFAGVTLPDAVNDAFQRAGVALPNQAEDALLNAEGRPENLPGGPEIEGQGGETSQAVLSAIDGWTGDRDCWFGLAVASAATGEEKDTGPCQRGGGATAARGSKATGDEKSGGASTAGSGNAATAGRGGPATAGEKSGGASTSGADNASGAGAQGGGNAGGEASEKRSENQDNAPRPTGAPGDEE